MMNEVQSSEYLGAIEEALVQQQAFGDSDYIRAQLEVAFKRRLHAIADRLPSAGQLLKIFETADNDTRHRVAGNTVIRCAAQHAHTQLETGTQFGLPVAACEKVFEAATRHLEQGKAGTPFENGATHLQRLGPEPYHGWIWSEDYPNDVFGQCFRRILDHEYGESLCSIGDTELAQLRRGEALLQDLLPSLARSALGHAHLIGIFSDVGFWKGKLSSSQIRMGGIIFLNRQMLKSPWCVAEHLLHESLHQKLYDFRHGHSLLDPDFASEDAPKVCSLWNAQELNNANLWDTHRAFAAFHVYVQLALLASVAERRAEELAKKYGPFRGMIESRKALERARYLGEKLQEQCSDELGLAGKRFLDWLMSVLDFLDPAPAPKGAYFHLLLDLYQREANRVDAVFKEGPTEIAGLAGQLVQVAKEEVSSAQELLSAISAERELQQLNHAVGQFSDEEFGTKFPVVRRIIARSLLDASADGYGLKTPVPASFNPDALVKRMVDRGSERLYLIQANVPHAVASAKRRAKDLRFNKSCEDGVGRLLTALAAAVPSGGRILEIGTGAGVGLGWITAGLAVRTDVEVVSVESLPKLSNAAAAWAWPSFVQILTADAAEVLAELGFFDLVFVDAAPIKYGHIESTLAALRPGGMLVIDDLHADPNTSDRERREKNALQSSLRSYPDLHVVELDWSSGVILATLSRGASQPARDVSAKVGTCA